MTEVAREGQMPDPHKAKEYSQIKIRLSIVNLCLTLVVLLILIFSGLSISMRTWAEGITRSYYGIIFLYFVFFYVFNFIIGLPLDIYSSFFLEHRYSLSNQTLSGWVWENAKKIFLSFCLSVILIEVLYMLIAYSPERWWLWAWGFLVFVAIVLNKLIPVFIVPLFYKYTKIDDEALVKKIQNLVKPTSLKLENIYSLNLSKTTKKANAAFMGLGKTKRVVLGDTLLSHFTHDEIEMVVAHELGHYVHKDIWKNIALSTVMYFISFYIAYYVLSSMISLCGFSGAADVASFPLLCLVFFVFGVIVMPAQNVYSRFMERLADQYALHATKNKSAFVTAMNKLGDINLSDPSPHPLIEFIFYSHPSIRKRIEMAEAYAG